MSEFDDALAEVSTAMKKLTEEIMQALRPALAVAVDMLADFFAWAKDLMLVVDPEELVRRAAVEHAGIPESDIRRVEGTVVHLWNWRRVDVAEYL